MTPRTLRLLNGPAPCPYFWLLLDLPVETFFGARWSRMTLQSRS